MKDFTLTSKNQILIAKFLYEEEPFEIYAESRDPLMQMGYLHLRAEENLLRLHGNPLREEVRRLKKLGLKTEPAFAKALGLDGDPYLELLKFAEPH